MDMAAEYAGYRSDMTRTILFNGRFTPRQRDVYDAVVRALRGCNELLRPGVLRDDYRKQFNAVMEREIINLVLAKEEKVAGQDPENSLYKKYFMHGISHHIGIDVHDAGVLLAPGMVLTVEEYLMDGVPLKADEIEAAMAADS